MNTQAFQLLNIPSSFWNIPYDATQYPGSPVKKDISQGANCQRFVYELLRHFGKPLPPFRSRELWEDRTYTLNVSGEWKPLDLFLWNNKPEAYGAHVGLYMGGNQVIHLSKRVGFPEIRETEYFSDLPAYRFFIGAKRVK